MTERRAGLVEVACAFLKIGAMSYGGPAIMGTMQAEIQERRQWISKQDFVHGLALVSMLPGPGATQLAIFLGHANAGLAGGIVAGVCFILPAFLMMLALAVGYAAVGAFPLAHSAFYGIGPVVVGLFAAATYRLGRSTLKDRSQMAIGAAVVMALLFTPLSLATVLLAAGCVGVALFYSPRIGVSSMALLAAAFGATSLLAATLDPVAPSSPPSEASGPGLWQLGSFFLEVGAFSFGGGLSMLAFIQDQVVNQLGWLTPQQFVDGLALGQLTPGPILMLAAFIGFKTAGVAGATVAASAIFLPSFLMILSVLPVLRRLKDLDWLKAFMRGVGPAVIGALGVSLVEMLPRAAPDAFALSLFGATVALVLQRRVGPLTLMLGGGLAGLIGERVARWAR